MLTRSRSKVRRSRRKVRRSKARYSRSKVRYSRSKVRRSRIKVRRTKIGRSKVRRSRRKRHDGLNFVNDSVIITNEEIKNATIGSGEFGMIIFNGNVISYVNSKLERPYKIQYRKYDTENETYTYENVNSICEQDKITKALKDLNRGERDIIVKSAIFDEGVVFDNNKKNLMITSKVITYAKDKNKINELKVIIENYLKNIEEPIEIRFKIKKTNQIIKPCKIDDILNAFNNERRELNDIFVYTSKKVVNKPSLIRKISEYTKLSESNLKLILGGISTAVLASIVFYLTRNNKNMSKDEMKNYLVKIANKNKK